MRSVDHDVREAYWSTEENPDDPQRWFVLGQALLRRNRVSSVSFDPLDEPAALLALYVALDLEPADAKMCFEIGRQMSTCAASSEMTIKAFIRAAELETGWPEPCAFVAQLFFDALNKDEAESWVRQGLDRAREAGSSPAVFTDLARVLGQLGHWREVVDVLIAAHGEDPDDSTQLIDLAIAAQRAGDIARAIQWAQRAVEQQPNQAAAHQTLGRCFEAQGDLDRATSYYQAALSIDPASSEADKSLQRIRTQSITTPATEPPAAGQADAADPEHGCLIGDLAMLSIPDLFEVIRFHKRSGELTLRQGEHQVHLAFCTGALVGGQNTHGQTFCVDDDKASDGPHQPFDNGQSHAEAFFHRLLREIIRWKTGQFEFRQSEQPLSARVERGLDPRQILLEVVDDIQPTGH